MRHLYLYLMIATLSCLSFESAHASQNDTSHRVKKHKYPKDIITMDVAPWWEEEEEESKGNALPDIHLPDENNLDVPIPEEELDYTGEESQVITPPKNRDLAISNYVPMPSAKPKKRDLGKTQYVPMPKMPSHKRELGKTQYAPIHKVPAPENTQDMDEMDNQPSSTLSSMDKGYTVQERKKFFEELAKNN